jgi:Tol biopolymer transport system component
MSVGLPRWSPDGKQIAFMGQMPGKPIKIYRIAAEGGRAEQLTTGDHNDADPNWSADGTSLVFAGNPSIESGIQSINLLNLKTRQVTTVPGSEGLFTPRWSPDGRHIDAGTGEAQKLGTSLSVFRNRRPPGLNGSPDFTRAGRWSQRQRTASAMRLRSLRGRSRSLCRECETFYAIGWELRA